MGPVLVVDDDPVLRQTMADVMEDRGYSVLSAADAEQALQIMHKRPDLKLVLADIVMPGMSGLRLAEAARGDDALKEIPIVLMTAAASLPSPDRVPCIKKPFSLDMLLAVVAQHVH